MPDQENLVVAGRELLGVEGASGQLGLVLWLDPQWLAGEPGGVRRANLRTRQAHLHFYAELGQRRTRGARLALALLRKATLRVGRSVLGLAVTEKPDHRRPL